jgi:dienelactone hydrolase
MQILTVLLCATGVLSATTIVLPAGSGPFGTTLGVSNFTDYTRNDPYSPKKTARNLMLSVFAPIPRKLCDNFTTPYMPDFSAAFYDQVYSPLTTNGSFEAFEMSVCSSTHQASSHQGSKSCRTPPAYPLLIFSPGSGNSRLIYNALAQSIASYGYYVITIDHPYDALCIEYPDGSYILAANYTTDADYEAAIAVRAQDILALNNALSTSSTLQQLLPSASIKIDEIYVAGHSLGGATALSVLLQDSRIRAGANFDGRFFPGALPKTKHIQRPFLLVGNQDRVNSTDDFWELALQRNIKGPWAELQMQEWEHGTFTDLPMLLTSAGLEGYVDGLGDVNGTRTVEIMAQVLVRFMRTAEQSSTGMVAELRKELMEFPEVQVISTNQS